mmetsp:Transcript_41601/g.111557  ORF Transcript_41601/g.111557 Transcript_41601/m.111557 type:complete len:123 (+) Transcript_41601:209-577(+)
MSATRNQKCSLLLLTVAVLSRFTGVAGGCAAGYFGPLQPRVLLVHTESQLTLVDNVASKLMSTGNFATVGSFDATSSGPSPSVLASYDALLVWASPNILFYDSTQIGNLLADFWDQVTNQSQ